jgi:copper chaperone NosL
MVITDQRYGTEILTPKGKAYKFDSFECLVDYQKESPVEVGQYLITSFDQPGKLQNAENSWVIKCKEMPSPMGRYLTVFKEKEKATDIIQEKEGEILPFKDALQKF